MASHLSSSSSIQSRKILPREQALSLLKKKIDLRMTISSQEVICVATDVEEIYAACKKTLQCYGPVDLAIRGSSVAGLFSGEKASDLDLQARFKFTHLKDPCEIVREGRNLKWKLLESIRVIVLQKIAPEKQAVVRSASLDAFNFKDTNVLSAHLDQGSCNIHQVQIGEVEISCFVEVDPSKQAQRNFDFNSGALEIILNEKGEVLLQSPCENIEATIQEISVKELRCIRPHEISRRAFARYCNKIYFSGYTDPSLDLLPALLETAIKQSKKESTQEIAKDILEELSCAFKDKKNPLWMLYLSVWLTQDELPLMQEMRKLIQQPLLELLASQKDPFALQISSWLDNDCYEAIAWFLVLQASTIHIKTHRGQPYLQLFIKSPYPCHILIPAESFSKTFSTKDMGVFFLEECRTPLEQELKQETKEFLQRSLGKQIKHPEFFPAFQGLSQKFSFKVQPAFIPVFLKWFQTLPAQSQESLAFERLSHLLPHFQKDQDLELSSKIALLKIIKKHLIESEISCFDPSLNPAFVLACLNKLIKEQELLHLNTHDQEQIISLIERFQKQYYSIYNKDQEYLKPIINLSLYLHKNKRLSFEELLIAAHLCFDHGHHEQGSKLLEMVALKAPWDLKQKVLDVCVVWSQKSPKKLLEFLKKYGEGLSNIEGFSENSFSQFHLHLVATLAKDDFMVYCQILEQLEKPLVIELAKQLEPQLLANCERTLQFAAWTLKTTGCSIDRIINFEQLDASSFVWVLEHEMVKAAFEKDTSFRQKIFRLAVFHRQIPVAMTHLEYFMKENPENALLMLLDVPQDLLRSFPCTELVQIALNFDKKGLSYAAHPHMTHFIDPILEMLSFRIESNAQIKLSEAECQLIQKFHQKFMLETSSHDVWIKVWEVVVPQIKERQLKNWIPEDKLLEGIEHYRLSSMKPLLLQLEVSLDFIEKFAVGLFELFKRVDAHSRQDLDSMLFNFIERTKGFWELDLKNYRHNSSASHQFRAFLGYFMSLTKGEQVEGKKSEELLQLLFLSLKGFSLFCSSQERKEEVGCVFVDIMESQAGRHKEFFVNNGMFQQLLLSLILKAYQEKDIEQSLHLFLFYRHYFSPDITSQSLFKSEHSVVELSIGSLDALCRETIRFMDSICLASEKDSLRDQIAVATLYHHFLSDMLMTLEEAAESVEGEVKQDLIVKRQKVLGYMKDQLERVARSDNIHLCSSCENLFNYKEKISTVNRLEIAKKLLKVTGDLMRRKKGITNPQELKTVVFFINLVDRLVDIEQIMQESCAQEVLEFLQEIRPFIFLMPRLSFVNKELLDLIRTFEASLPKHLLEEYVFSWLHSIVRRKKDITLEEMNTASILMLKLDPHTGESFGINPLSASLQKIFKKKQVDFLKAFSDKDKLETFIRFFGIAFEKFGDQIPKDPSNGREVVLNVFFLFLRMNSYIRQNAKQIKQEKESKQMFSLFLDVLHGQLLAESNLIEASVVACSWNSLFTTEKRKTVQYGKPRFRFFEKDNIKRSCELFYLITKKTASLPEIVRRGLELSSQPLCDLYTFYQDQLRTHLTVDQLREIEAYLFNSQPAAKAALAPPVDPAPSVSTAPPAVNPDSSAQIGPVEWSGTPMQLFNSVAGFWTELVTSLKQDDTAASASSRGAAAASAGSSAGVQSLTQNMKAWVLDSDEEE